MISLIETIRPYLPYVLGALPFVLGIIALAVNGRLESFLRETVAAVYRTAIHVANELQDEGLNWLRSPAGVSYRRELAGHAYDLLPARVGPVPVAPIVKMLVSRDVWCELVEGAFTEVVALAERLEIEAPPVASAE